LNTVQISLTNAVGLSLVEDKQLKRKPLKQNSFRLSNIPYNPFFLSVQIQLINGSVIMVENKDLPVVELFDGCPPLEIVPGTLSLLADVNQVVCQF
jgi:hypothetical protein